MVELDYYDPWYLLAPQWHKTVGILLLGLLVVRWIWRTMSITPELLSGSLWQQHAARFVHYFFYILIALSCISGYFIATAKGADIDIVSNVALPALLLLDSEQADIMSAFHTWTVNMLMALSALHALAALKHHFIDKDTSLMRILTPIKKKEKNL